MDYTPLASKGAIRIALAVGPTKSQVWTQIPEGGTRPEGVTVDMVDRIAEITGLPVELVYCESSGHIIAAANDDLWDLSFTPVDDARQAVVDFGSAYHSGESTYLVREGASFQHAADLNMTGARILGVTDTATLRSAERAAPLAEVRGTGSLAGAIEAFRRGECDALALGRLSLNEIVTDIPGTRITEGNFHLAETAVAVPKGKDLAVLQAASHLVDTMKAEGIVAASFARHGLAR